MAVNLSAWIRAIRGDNFVLLRLQISFHDEKTDTSS